MRLLALFADVSEISLLGDLGTGHLEFTDGWF